MAAIFMNKELDEPSALFSGWLKRLSDNWQGTGNGEEISAEEALRALWQGVSSHASGAAREDLPPLDCEQIERLEDLVRLVETGAPLAHATGRATFMGLELLSGPEALIPQRETELLAACALDILRDLVRQRGKATVFDVCTGAGNLALALAHGESNCRVFATDLSEEAVLLARRNAARLNLNERMEVVSGDLFAPMAQSATVGKADLIVCNPPYISSAKVSEMPKTIARCGPRLAFDGGPFGLNILSRLVQESPSHLKPASFLCFEVGSGQGPCLLKLMGKMPSYAEVRTASDENGTVRVLIARTA